VLQFGRAAEIYKKMKRPEESSRCYEQLDNFNTAVTVLYENDLFDLAIDTIKRYTMRINVSIIYYFNVYA